MANYLVLVFTRAVEGREAEFDHWYENTHLADVLSTVPGWTSAQRFNLDHQSGVEMPSGHLAMYEAEGESPKAVVDALNRTRSQRDISDSMDASQFAIWVFSSLGERHEFTA